MSSVGGVMKKEDGKLLRRLSIMMVAVLAIGVLICSCSPKGEEGTTAEGLSPKHGGILRNAYQPVNHMDPAFIATGADDHVAFQWNDRLVYIDEENEPDVSRSIAEKWSPSEDGKEWTFELRKGIKFHDGKEMTSKDVKFTFDRLRDPDVGAATVEMYSNINDILTPDDYTVVFELEEQNPDFLKDLADYHALIMDADNTDFATNWNGVGPFKVASYIPEDRIVFERNPDYWMKDEDGFQLPYLDGMEFIFVAESSAQVEALRSGQVDYLIYLPTEFVPVLQKDENIVVHQEPSNYAYVIRMRSDRAPADDVRVRQAIKAATDRSAILEATLGGMGWVGSDTPISPAFGDFYLDKPEPKRDVEKAKKLLAEAGYQKGLDITIHVMDEAPVPDMATIWKEQLEEAGINLDIQIVPYDAYYDKWLEYDFGITDWASRPYPQPYLDLAYTSKAVWNESHWSDDELDELAAQAAKEMDHDKRVQLYHKIQEVFIERGSIIPIFKDSLWAMSKNLKGFKPTRALEVHADLRCVYFEEE